MGKKRIGINYNTSTGWIGGKYYLDSIINELKKNSENEIVILKKPFFMRCIGKICGRNSFLYKLIYYLINKKEKLDIVFPAIRGDFSGKKDIYWIPDFQENYYPEFFDNTEIVKRMTQQINIAYSNDVLVLSSESAKADFERLFPKHTCKVFVLSFISSLAGKQIEFCDFDELKEKYNINQPFFICSNQLWKHKNHIVVIKAIEELKRQGCEVLCLFTGQEEDYRNPNYPAEIKALVEQMQLQDNIKFLGFIPRKDQLTLMKEAIAVIQPSLFEGWNTTIEDAKVLEKNIIASNISVHKEQLKITNNLFDVNDYETLSKMIISMTNRECEIVDYEYEKQEKTYARGINSIFI